MKTLNDFYRLFPSVAKRAVLPVATAPVTVQDAEPVDEPARLSPRYRQRTVGSGYGRSSGYAKDHSYAASHDARLIRVC